jgi:hypothetical protein
MQRTLHALLHELDAEDVARVMVLPLPELTAPFDHAAAYGRNKTLVSHDEAELLLRHGAQRITRRSLRAS